LLSVRNLQVSLLGAAGEMSIVKGLDLDLSPGQITGLAGASGCGKSMTALALMGMLPGRTGASTADRMQLGSTNLLTLGETGMRRLRGRRMALIFQDPATALDPVFRVGHQLQAVIRRTRGESAGQARNTALASLEAVGFADPHGIGYAYPHELSGGMRQLVMIAMATAVRPEILLADEPTTALDVTTQAVVLARLAGLADQQGTGILLISHDLAVIAQTASDCLIMAAGQIVEQGPCQSLFANPGHACSIDLLAAIPRLDSRPGAPRTAGTTLLEGRGLGLHFARRSAQSDQPLAVLDEVSLAIGAGEIVGLAGESGAGKSTLGRVLAGLVQAETGSVLLEGQDRARLDKAQSLEARRRVQILFQDPATALSPRRNIAQILREPLDHFGIGDPGDRAARTNNALAEVGLEADALDRYPHQFSSGQRQRIAIARALIVKPDLLIADEPVSALDVSVQARILDLLRDLRDQLGIAVLLISHDLAVIRQLADRVDVMYRGRIIESAPADALFATPGHPYTRQLLAAVPSLDPERTMQAPVAAIGDIPDGEGCPFRTRCPEHMDICDHTAPKLKPLTDQPGHHVECLNDELQN
jgi:peptide/nickel transport system ATP-binding protein